jgi:hypothetical protein
MADDGGIRDAEDVDRPNTVFPVLTTPTRPKRHARPHRGIDVVPSSSFTGGRFGRMFRNLPVFELSDLKLLTPLAKKMVPAAGGAPAENPDIPSGYTYLGQFIDHDITFDPVSSLQRQNDPDALHNVRTPRFDLDSLYGRGPGDQPYLYQDGVKLLLGESVQANGPAEVAGPDLPRNQPRERNGTPVFRGRALTGDPRNDENLVISQLHLTFLKFHNAVVEHVATATPLRGDNLFKEAQRLTRWHYQWVVVYDFLRRIVGDEVIDDILRPEPYVVHEHGTRREVEIPRWRPWFYDPHEDAYMPVEFSVAAYRFGHSMVRGRYHINTFLQGLGAGPFPIFGDIEPEQDELTNLNGFRRLPPDWGFEWPLFFEMPGAGTPAQPSLAIDPILAGPLGKLPPSVASDPPASLAERNLQRGVRLGLPSGTSVARRMGIEPLTPDQLELAGVAPELRLHPPRWYYVLKEAQVLAGGRRLGPVGGRIVAEVLLGMLALDPLSYHRVQPGWRPQPPFARDDGTFDMPQLIRFALQP